MNVPRNGTGVPRSPEAPGNTYLDPGTSLPLPGTEELEWNIKGSMPKDHCWKASHGIPYIEAATPRDTMVDVKDRWRRQKSQSLVFHFEYSIRIGIHSQRSLSLSARPELLRFVTTDVLFIGQFIQMNEYYK